MMFSAAGSRIHNTKSTMDRLKAHKIFIEGSERIESIKDYTGVIFPVLSRNTASKGANLIFDGYAAELMVDALMLGIPVVAAKDAADVESLGWSKLGFRWANANSATGLSLNHKLNAINTLSTTKDTMRIVIALFHSKVITPKGSV